MPDLEVPPDVAEFADRLANAGFREIRRETWSMDSGQLAFRREPIELAIWKDRSQWLGISLSVDGWRRPVEFPLLDIIGGIDPYAPRRNRDPARDYDVPPQVRWLIRQLLSAKLAETSASDRPRHLVFAREPVTVVVRRGPEGWDVILSVDGGDAGESVDLPCFARSGDV